MPWKYAGGVLKEGREFTGSDGTQYPKVWMRYSADKKKAIGITWEDPPASEAPFDNRFYSGRQSDGTLIEKKLADVDVVDDEGKAVNDPMTGKQAVTLGLKSVWVAQTKSIAASKLAKHDWYVTRNAEKSTAIPSSVTTYRDSVRTKCAEIETALNGAANLTAFMALFKDEHNSDGTLKTIAKINDWPDEI